MNPFKTLLATEPQHDQELFVVYDSKGKCYSERIGFSQNKETAIREFIVLFKEKPKDLYFTNAEDYSLFKIGTYTKKTGKIEVLASPEHVVNFMELRSTVEAQMQQEMRRIIQQQQEIKNSAEVQ